MLRVRRHDLVLRPELQPGQDDVAAVGRRARQCHLGRRGTDQSSNLLAYAGAELEHAHEPAVTASSLLLVEAKALLHS